MPPANGIPTNLSKREIITGHKLDCNKYSCLQFGAYVEVQDEPALSKGEKPRTLPYIALSPTCNIQGTFKFMNLNTEKRILKSKWTELPMPDFIIKQIVRKVKSESRYIFFLPGPS